jgi:hypothetical protein
VRASDGLARRIAALEPCFGPEASAGRGLAGSSPLILQADGPTEAALRRAPFQPAPRVPAD